MVNDLLSKLVDKSLTREELLQSVKQDPDLLPVVLNGTSSSKAAIRYGCAKVLMDLSNERPEQLYPHMDFFVKLLDRDHRILTWNAMAIIANLIEVDTEKVFDSIFDKYYRSQAQKTSETAGSGLGLTLVRHIIDSHGGRVDVESEVGKGSTFTLLIPMKS